MIYSRLCPNDDELLTVVEDHVRTHISQCVSFGDDPYKYYRHVNVLYVAVPDSDMVLVRGELEDMQPTAMPRSAGIGLAQRIQQELTRRGIPWRVLPGAETRGNGQSWGAVVGAIMHHTATAYGPAPSVLWNGRGEPNPLSGPLCNTAGEADGTIAFVSYNPANHAGASGGKSMGPLPVTNSFNKLVWGHEIVYPGTSPMRDAQYHSATGLAASIATVLGKNTECIRAHAETSITGKWDPGYASGKTIDMAKFRRDAASWEGAEDMPLTDADVKKIWDHGVQNAFGTVVPVNWIVAQTEGRAQKIQQILSDGITEAVREALGRDDQALADAILTKLKERL